MPPDTHHLSRVAPWQSHHGVHRRVFFLNLGRLSKASIRSVLLWGLPVTAWIPPLSMRVIRSRSVPLLGGQDSYGMGPKPKAVGESAPRLK
jgi:hypothetical protein